MKLLQIFVTILLLYGAVPALGDNINYFGVAYSPYVRSDGALWNSYTLEDVKKMLRITLANHNSISSYSMGVSGQLKLK